MDFDRFAKAASASGLLPLGTSYRGGVSGRLMVLPSPDYFPEGVPGLDSVAEEVGGGYGMGQFQIDQEGATICGTRRFTEYAVHGERESATEVRHIRTTRRGLVRYVARFVQAASGHPAFDLQVEVSGEERVERIKNYPMMNLVTDGRFAWWFVDAEGERIAKVDDIGWGNFCDYPHYPYGDESAAAGGSESKFEWDPPPPQSAAGDTAEKRVENDESAGICSGAITYEFSGEVTEAELSRLLGEWRAIMEGYLRDGNAAAGSSAGAWAYATGHGSGEGMKARGFLWRISLPEFTGDLAYLNNGVSARVSFDERDNGAALVPASFRADPGGLQAWHPPTFGLPSLNDGRAAATLLSKVGESERYLDAWGGFGDESASFDGLGQRAYRADRFAPETPPGSALAARSGDYLESGFLSLTGLAYRFKYSDVRTLEDGGVEFLDYEFATEEREGYRQAAPARRIYDFSAENLYDIEWKDGDEWRPLAESPLRDRDGAPLPALAPDAPEEDGGLPRGHLIALIRHRSGREWGFPAIDGTDHRYAEFTGLIEAGYVTESPEDGVASCGGAPQFRADYSLTMRFEGGAIAASEGSNAAESDAGAKPIYETPAAGYQDLWAKAHAAPDRSEAAGELRFEPPSDAEGNPLFPQVDAIVARSAPSRAGAANRRTETMPLRLAGGRLVSDWQFIEAPPGRTVEIAAVKLTR